MRSWILIFLAVLSFQVLAEDVTEKSNATENKEQKTTDNKSPWLWMSELTGSYSNTNSPGASSPTMLAYSIDFTGGRYFGPEQGVLFGFSTDYQLLNQLSDPSSSNGNYTGTRWTILSPTVGYSFANNLLLMADIEFLGNYVISKTTSSGDTLTYKSPTGVRVHGTYPLKWPKFYVGGQIEYVTFSKLAYSQAGESTLLQNQNILKIGGLIAYQF